MLLEAFEPAVLVTFAGGVNWSVGFLTTISIFAILALGLNVQWGYGGVFNVGGCSPLALRHACSRLEDLIGAASKLKFGYALPVDARNTSADIARAAAELRYRPSVDLASGLAEQVSWQRGFGD